MNDAVFSLHRGSTPLLVSLPHAGTQLTPELQTRLVARAAQVEDTDWFLERLYAFVAEMGASLIVPRHSRYVVDLNRPSDNQPMYAGANNTELCPTRFFTGEPLYREGCAPAADEVAQRVRSYWQPYHDALRDELARLKRTHGHAIVFDGHSIKSRLPWLFEGQLPDLNLGTAAGQACAPSLRDALADLLNAQTTYTVAIDGRFKGGHITRQYGRPAEGVHAVQLEMCWRTYMRREPAVRLGRSPRGAGAAAAARDGAHDAAVAPCRCRVMSAATLLWAPQAWWHGRWHDDVLLQIGADGHWADVQAGVAPPEQAERLAGPVLAGLVNAHSHAFQRAFAGLSERRDDEHDDFWSWRDRMYRVALRIGPQQLRAVAAQLYAELLRGGYTQVCEFHYLHHRPDGTPYDDAAQMSWALADAADDAGIGLTVLPVLYQRAGFDQPGLRDDQRRFASDVRAVLDLQHAVQASGRARLSAGVAVHSLRAAEPAAITALAEACGDVPIHIHIAEQTAEVAACLAAHGLRPIEWLAGARCARRPLAAGACHACHAGRDRGGGALRRRRGAVPFHRGQPGRWPGRPARLAARRRAVGHRLRQPCHTRLARRAALARIRPAAAAAPAQHRRRTGAGPALDGGAAVVVAQRWRRSRRRLHPLGPAAGRACRPAGDRHRRCQPARRATRAAARRAGVFQPRAAVSRRDGGRALGAARTPSGQRRRRRVALHAGHARALGRALNTPAFIADYFGAEKLQAVVFMAVGVAAIAWAAWLLRTRSVLRGMAGPLVAVALVQLVVGATVYLRSDVQLERLTRQQQQQPAAFKADESARLRTVLDNFAIYKRIEIGLLALGMALVVLLRARPFWFAFGLGLVLQAALMLALDQLAQARARDYLKLLLAS